MKTHNWAVTGVVAGVALLASTQAFAASTSPCVRNIDIWGYSAPNDKTLILETSRHKKFKVSVMGTCWNLDFKEHVAFRSIGGSELSCLSRGDQVISHDMGMRQTCSITKIEDYTPAMQAADKAAKEAKKNHASY